MGIYDKKSYLFSMKRILPFLTIVIFSYSISAQCSGGRFIDPVFSQVKITKNITFHRALTAGNYYQNVKMDVYEPKNDTMALRPLLIYMHGGAYWTGTKEYDSDFALGQEFAKRGYVFCSSDYRLEENFVSLLFPDMMIKAVGRGVQDTKMLIRYFFNSARDSGNVYRIDTTKIFIAGASAGAFNVMHTVYFDEEDALPEPEWGTWLGEVGGVFGDYDFIDFSERLAGVININGALGSKEFMNNQRTPFLSVHNTFDPEIPFNTGKPYKITTLMNVDGSNVLHQKANELGIYNPFYIIPGVGHTSFSSDLFGTVVQPYFDSTVWYMRNFMAHELCGYSPTFVKQPKIDKLNLFPNPAADYFEFSGLNQQAKYITVSDLSGKVQVELPYAFNRYSTRDWNLPPGLYLVQLLDTHRSVLASGKLVLGQ